LKDSLSRSRNKADVRSISLMIFCGGLASESFFITISHFAIRDFKSASRSATNFPSATVRMIMPKFLGRMLVTKRLSRLRSSWLLIFCETEIRLENGTNTRYLPANEISEVTRGPFVDMGSFAI